MPVADVADADGGAGGDPFAALGQHIIAFALDQGDAGGAQGGDGLAGRAAQFGGGGAEDL